MDFKAVRIGFVNILPKPFTVERVVATPSDCWNDMVNPVGDRDWREFVQTVSKPGGTEFRTQSAIDIHGSDHHPSQLPRWTWTDWLNIENTAVDALTGMRVLMIRYTLVRQHVTYVVGQFHEWSTAASFTHGFRYFIGGYNNGFDAVSAPVPLDYETARQNSLFNGSLIAAVQFKTSARAVVGCVAGDSHFEGTGTTSQFYNAVAQLTLRHGQEFRGRTAFGLINAARGGATSADFLPRAAIAIEEFQPSYIVVPSWTFNDINLGGAPVEATLKYFSNLKSFVRLARTRNVQPVLVSPIPRDVGSMTADRVGAWLLAYRLAQDMAANDDVAFVDVSKLLSVSDRGAPLGTWPHDSPFTNDGVHPNDLGHGVLSNFIWQTVLSRLA